LVPKIKGGIIRKVPTYFNLERGRGNNPIQTDLKPGPLLLQLLLLSNNLKPGFY